MVVDIMYECADISEHEFDVEVELGMSGLRVNYTFVCYCLESNCCYYMTQKNILCHISRCTDITTGMLNG